MQLLTGKTLDQTLKDFNKTSWRVNALNYNQFLNREFYNGKSIMDVLYYLQKVVKYSRNKNINKRLSEKTNINLVLDFYETLGLRDKVEPIVLGQHPMFITVIDKKSPSQVCHKGKDSQLTFTVGETGTFDGVVNLAHECAHAINGHYLTTQIFVKKQNEVLKEFGKDSQEFKAVNQKYKYYLKSQANAKHDCISETETKIIELLFLDFLIDKNTISPEDKQSYLNQRNNSFRNDLKLMFKEDLIYSTISEIKKKKECHLADINEEDFNEMCEHLKKNPRYEDLMEGFYFISNRQQLNKPNWHSSYRFRYVVGHIISTVWYDKYISSNKKEKQQMIEDLKTFVENNHKFKLKNTTELLLNDETYGTIINKFIELHKSKTAENNI